jgi:hypothetical protein
MWARDGQVCRRGGGLLYEVHLRLKILTYDNILNWK